MKTVAQYFDIDDLASTSQDEEPTPKKLNWKERCEMIASEMRQAKYPDSEDRNV